MAARGGLGTVPSGSLTEVQRPHRASPHSHTAEAARPDGTSRRAPYTEAPPLVRTATGRSEPAVVGGLKQEIF